MVEGDNVFKEAIQFLKELPPLKPLQWDVNLAQSAQEHVDDIGPKGLLLYQSSDGTEPEDRITKYGNYEESLGENIDFGPNDAMGVIISLTLDDGEEERPHRENLFKSDYQKVGIACGPHKTEFQMCVMDFAYDFKPKIAPNELQNQNYQNNRNKPLENLTNYVDNDNNNEGVNNKNMYIQQLDQNENMNNPAIVQHNQGTGNELDQIIMNTTNIINNLKVVSKKVEIITKVTYTYADGSTKVVTQNEMHEFKE